MVVVRLWWHEVYGIKTERPPWWPPQCHPPTHTMVTADISLVYITRIAFMFKKKKFKEWISHGPGSTESSCRGGLLTTFVGPVWESGRALQHLTEASGTLGLAPLSSCSLHSWERPKRPALLSPRNLFLWQATVHKGIDPHEFVGMSCDHFLLSLRIYILYLYWMSYSGLSRQRFLSYITFVPI